MEEESHEVFTYNSDGARRREPLRNPFSRVTHCFLILPLMLILALALTSLSYVAVTDSRVGDLDSRLPGDGKCVLYAKWVPDKTELHLSDGHACVFSIFGEAAVAVLAALLVLWMVIKAAAGFYAATWMVFLELPVLILHMIFAFCVSVTISIGLAVTCGQYKQYPEARGGCSNYTLPKPESGDGQSVPFYRNIVTAMVTSWLVVILLSIVLLAYVVMSIVFCIEHTKKTVAIPVSDGESSSDGEKDEDLVPIAELEHR